MRTSILRFIALLGAVLVTCCAGPNARAAFTMDVSEIGPDVVATGSGTINTDSLTLFLGGTHQTFLSAQLGLVSAGPASIEQVDLWGSVTGPGPVGPGDQFFATAGSGDDVAVFGTTGFLFLPRGYISGSPLADTATWAGQTLDSLGLTAGTYTWTWGSDSTADSFTVNITAAVPEPASLGLLATAAIMLCRSSNPGRIEKKTRPGELT